jgi:ubiquinone/menaquinone biosynthesis C-methylase UbiE
MRCRPVSTWDFDSKAAVFDRYLPLLEPVGRAVLDKLPPLVGGASVLDVACGTGEPGLTLARRAPSVRLLGVDGAPAMIEIARVKAARQELGQADSGIPLAV